jgi:hypothetical protein
MPEKVSSPDESENENKLTPDIARWSKHLLGVAVSPHGGMSSEMMGMESVCLDCVNDESCSSCCIGYCGDTGDPMIDWIKNPLYYINM